MCFSSLLQSFLGKVLVDTFPSSPMHRESDFRPQLFDRVQIPVVDISACTAAELGDECQIDLLFLLP